MQNKIRYLFIVVLVMLWSLFSGCYSYLAHPDIPFHEGQELNYFEKLIDDSEIMNDLTYSDSEIMNDLTYSVAKNCELRVKRFDSEGETDKLEVDKAEALAAPLLLRFVWLSDVHITQREIKLGSDWFSNAMAEVNPVTEYNRAQTDFHWAIYLSQIAAINALHRENPKEPVDFMIHTGDSVNTGSVEELYQFIYISNKLQIPWLNIVGNHDITIFGNYKARLGYGHDPNVNFWPIGDLGNFVWMHRSKDESKISGYGRHLLPVPGKHEPSISSSPDSRKLARTFLHGFDLKSGNATCKDEPAKKFSDDYFYNNKDEDIGDYATDLCGISTPDGMPIPVRLIVLNSSPKDAFGSEGSITDNQLKRLEKELQHKSGGIKLVFFHHRPRGFDRARFSVDAPPADGLEKAKTLLENSNGTSVVFTGHVHPKSKYDVTWHPGKNGRGFYELNTGAVIEYPQIGRLIELRRDSKGRVWLIARALWSSLMKVREKDMPSETERKKILCKCIIEPNTKQEDMQRKLEVRKAIQRNLADSVLCGYYGAYDDYKANRGRVAPWSRPQTFDKTWENANVIIEITPRTSE
jgi:hypothetical protein